jgi:hypothetical protein
MTQDDTANIKKAVGVRSVFLAARRDKNLVGRFFHMEGQFLLGTRWSSNQEASSR